MLPSAVSRFRIAYVGHTFRSDWNNGNAHFLRGLMRAMSRLDHAVTIFELENNWSITNLQSEERGRESLATFDVTYSDLKVETYGRDETEAQWRDRLQEMDVVILHEWTTPEIARRLLALRNDLGFRLLFHDTHHRASTKEHVELLGLRQFDGVLAFGESLRRIYREELGIEPTWTMHEAADVTEFYPMNAPKKGSDVVWVGNWGEGDRAAEIREYLLGPAAAMADVARFAVYGVRYPQEGLEALRAAHVQYGGYLPNLSTRTVYASSKLTVHIPRQQYSSKMVGIPTIRVFEALACGIPLISAPWQDSEHLFRDDDFCKVQSGTEMISSMRTLLNDSGEAEAQGRRGLETVLARHTCAHRAQELTNICKELLS